MAHFIAMDHVVLLLVCVAPVVQCYGSGRVMESCGDMQPHHAGQSPQTGPAPFTITTDRSRYRLGEAVTVQLQAPPSTRFIGFLLQAREVGGQSAVGSFALTSAAVQRLTCNQKPNSAVSHTSASVKTSIQVTWISEASADPKPVQFHASFVQDYKTFWVDVKCPALIFANDSTGGSSGSGTSLMTTPTMAATIQQPAPHVKSTISSAGCGVTKVCFSQPSNCDPSVSADCYFMSATMVSPSDAAVRFEMIGPSDGYISFGFSDDQMMGNDDIYICGIGSDGLVQVQHAFSTGRTTPQAFPPDNVSDVRASVQDTVISCSFTSMNTLSTQRTTGFNKTYYLIFAHGPSSNGQIQIHTDTFISTDKVDISTPQLVEKAGLPHIIKAHGALMLIAWMTTGSLGMMVARYLKGIAKGRNLWGKDVWFL
ncbi:putative ferric-chelate reductase 1, partial [Morone saxatilis]|uniref:putative ferric-chelate reductase 1 n=1 Tax=Morone saxatilis TaxID=34816 RepID=UPI0015E1FC5C